MKLPSHPAIDFIRAYWSEIMIAVVILVMGFNLFALSMENKVLKATLKNAATTISNYESAAKDNLATIKSLETANRAWADAANASVAESKRQADLLAEKERQHTKREKSLKSQLDEAHEKHKAYSDAVAPSDVTRRLRENSGQD